MDSIKYEQLADLFQGTADIFTEKKDELCEMDAKMGDGDLGLTMNKGYNALPQLIKENGEERNIGKTLAKAGIKMASIVPSTMGTLMASGFIQAGKALDGKSEIGAEELSRFFSAFAEGIQKRGKCQVGDRTILDAVDTGAKAAQRAFAGGGSLNDVMEAACKGAGEGVEATKNMTPKYGKAAVFAERAKGVPDQGAVAGQLLIEGMARYIRS